MSEETKSTITPEDIHMPPPSYWPILLALGITFILAGAAIHVSFAILGLLTSLTATIGWVTEPGFDPPHEHH